MTTATAADLVTSEGYFNFFPAEGRVLIEHWPSKHGRKAGYPRGTSMSPEAARLFYSKLRERAL
jgi:hypothetical protein